MNLTTPAIAIKPLGGSGDPAAIAADLRAIADLVENNAHLAAVIVQIFGNAAWPNHAVPYDQRVDPRAVMAETIRAFMPIASGPVEKQYKGDYFDAVIPL